MPTFVKHFKYLVLRRFVTLRTFSHFVFRTRRLMRDVGINDIYTCVRTSTFFFLGSQSSTKYGRRTHAVHFHSSILFYLSTQQSWLIFHIEIPQHQNFTHDYAVFVSRSLSTDRCQSENCECSEK